VTDVSQAVHRVVGSPVAWCGCTSACCVQGQGDGTGTMMTHVESATHCSAEGVHSSISVNSSPQEMLDAQLDYIAEARDGLLTDRIKCEPPPSCCRVALWCTELVQRWWCACSRIPKMQNFICCGAYGSPAYCWSAWVMYPASASQGTRQMC
jgi:hypothetical protein